METVDFLTAAALIDGEPVTGSDEVPVISPIDEEPIGAIRVSHAATVAAAVDAAKRAQHAWGRRTAVERGMVLRKWASAIAVERRRLATLLCREIGKPILEAFAEIDFAVALLQYAAEFDRRIDGVLLPADRADEHLWITPEPIGVVAAIVTWNAPVALAVRKVAPALIAGNTVVLKPHEIGSLAALEVLKLGLSSGLPRGVLNAVVGGADVGAALASSAVPGLITFTGGRATAKAIAAQAAAHLPATSFEMGGKAPFIVLDDSDLEEAAAAVITAKIRNSGQSCVATDRLLVHRSIAADFTRHLTGRMSTLKVGDPMERTVQVGPKVSASELARIERLVDDAVHRGARALTGGCRLRGGAFDRGYWYAPTLLTDVTSEMDLMQQEIFGPVLPIVHFDTFDDAIAIANDSPYGLAACIFTRDVRRVMRALRELECGEVYVNRPPGESVHGFHTGWKQSGMGGDDGVLGLQQYLRRKTVYLRA